MLNVSFNLQMSKTGWQKVRDQKKSRSRKTNSVSHRPLSEEEVVQFLSKFKTTPCQNQEFHDHRFCGEYHKDGDRRRNPYTSFYDVESCRNDMERMYHPVIFRTELCHNDISSCQFGKICARAHVQVEVRNRIQANLSYENMPVAMESSGLPQRSMSSFVDTPLQTLKPARRDYRVECRQIWDQIGDLPVLSAKLSLDPREVFLLETSASLRLAVDEAAFAEGLASVSDIKRNDTVTNAGGHLIVQGIQVASVLEKITTILRPPSDHFYAIERQCGQRVISALRNSAQWGGDVAKLKFAFLEFDDADASKCSLRITSVPTKARSGKEISEGILEKIEFWVKQEGYDKFAHWFFPYCALAAQRPCGAAGAKAGAPDLLPARPWPPLYR